MGKVFWVLGKNVFQRIAELRIFLFERRRNPGTKKLCSSLPVYVMRESGSRITYLFCSGKNTGTKKYFGIREEI